MIRRRAGKLTRDAVRRVSRRIDPPPRGVDVFLDIERDLPRIDVQVVFDVGANKGQSAVEFLAAFPRATVHSFEPATAAFEQLGAAVGESPRSRRIQAAVSDAPGTAHVSGEDDRASLSDEGEEVDVTTVDEYCATEQIRRIDYLKIDTEGNDLLVLRGAERTLAGGAAALVEVEAGFGPDNELHVPYEDLRAHLHEHDYVPFGLYTQVSQWPTENPHLRRADVLFVHRGVSDENRAPRPWRLKAG